MLLGSLNLLFFADYKRDSQGMFPFIIELKIKMRTPLQRHREQQGLHRLHGSMSLV